MNIKKTIMTIAFLIISPKIHCSITYRKGGKPLPDKHYHLTPYIYNLSSVPITIKNNIKNKAGIIIRSARAKGDGTLQVHSGPITMSSGTMARLVNAEKKNLQATGKPYYKERRFEVNMANNGKTYNKSNFGWTNHPRVFYKGTHIDISQPAHYIFSDYGIFYFLNLRDEGYDKPTLDKKTQDAIFNPSLVRSWY